MFFKDQGHNQFW